MPAKVRVEKASGNIPVMVQVQQVSAEGKWVNEGEPRPLMRTADMLEDSVHQNKRLVVYEMQLGNA